MSAPGGHEDPLAPEALSSARLDPGTVALIGGGPGALDLLTVRALALLRQADVVVVDRLGPAALVDRLGADVEVIEVGKAPGRHTLRQSEIDQLLVDLAHAGRRVARLKGGDPFLLGRGGEEVLACRDAGVPVQVVPGVSSALAGPAAADIPVTHRGSAVAVHVVNAHGDLGPADLAALADPGTTTVLLMGVHWLPRLVAQALLNGIDPATPVAIVQEATLPGQRTVHGTLGTIVALAEREQIGHPAVIVAGRTAADGFLEPGSDPSAPDGSEQADAPRSSAPVLIGCAHGTRLAAGRETTRRILMRVRELRPDLIVREAFVDVQEPEIGTAVAAAARPLADAARTRDLERVDAVVVPLLLSTGFHVAHGIGTAVRSRAACAAAPLGPDPRLAEVMAQRLTEAGARPDDAVVMAIAGTRDEAGQEMAQRMRALLEERLGVPVRIGFIAAAAPSVADAVAAARAERPGCRVAVASYLLAPGMFHGALEGSGADIVAAPLGDHPLIARIVVDRFDSVTGL